MTMLAETKEGRAVSLAEYEARIHLYKEQIGTGYIGIGRTLNEAKAAGAVPHGQWEEWVSRTTGLTSRQAQRCMQAATEIRDGSALARLEMSKALMLLGSGLEEEVREELAEKVAEEGTTVKELREQLRQEKLKRVQETGAATEIQQKLERAEAQKRQLEQQLIATQDAYRARMYEECEKAYRQGMADQIEEAERDVRKEYQGKIDFINSQRKQAEERIRSLKEDMEQARKEAREQWDRGFRIGKEQGEEKGQEAERELERLKRDRETILAAAEEAEKRAEAAEAELEEARSMQGPEANEPAVVTLSRAMAAFWGECELMPWYPEELQRDREPVLAQIDELEDWCRKMRAAVEKPLTAEGAIE